MRNFSFHSFLMSLSAGLMVGCYPVDPAPTTSAKVLRPVYVSYSEIRTVQTLAPQPLRNPGKIYIKDNLLLINEIDKGIHLIDNTDPAKPVKISFISIPGNDDLAIKGSVLYADNALDLVAIDLSNPRSVKVVKRIENAFPYPSYPAERGVRFECADPAKGVVVRWEESDSKKVNCRR